MMKTIQLSGSYRTLTYEKKSYRHEYRNKNGAPYCV